MDVIVPDSLADHKFADGCRKDLRIMVGYFMRQRGLSEEDIEDCTQECLLRFWKHFGSQQLLAQAIREQRSWILVCTKHQVINCCRTIRRRREYQDKKAIPLDCIAPEQSHDAIVIRQELFERIEICLQKLLPEQYLLLIQHYRFGETCANIAASLGITTNALEQRLLRSRRALLKLLIDSGISEAEVADYFAVTTQISTIHVIR